MVAVATIAGIAATRLCGCRDVGCSWINQPASEPAIGIGAGKSERFMLWIPRLPVDK
jgi:hypothetical protein